MSEASSVLAGQGRTVLDGMGERLLKLVSKGATTRQWAEWLRAPLEHAVANGDKDLAQCLLTAGANGGAGWRGCNGRTLLQAAAESGNQELVSTLLEKGGLAELDAVSGKDNMTALHRACERGHTAIARVLMIEGANPSLLDSRQCSVLHYAAAGGNLELIEYLMIAGVDLHAKNINGYTPLHLAAENGNEKVVCILLRRGSNTKVANCEGKHAVHLAVDNGHLAALEELLKAGADPNVRYGKSNKHSPLQLGRRDVAMMTALIKHGADVEAVDKLGYTALHWTATDGVAGVVDALLEAGANLEAPSSAVRLCGGYSFKGITPLHLAAFWRKFEAMASLLHKGANVNVKDHEGLTPLHVVCKSSVQVHSAEVADFLLRRGADETVSDKDGQLALDIVEKCRDYPASGRLKRLLVKAPADRTWRRRGMLVMCRSR
ncbi:unnamed protein product, partial [Hapterophycus canaliculatus]